MAQNFFTKCDGIIICFDIADKKTFENLDIWVNYINQYVEIKENYEDNINKKNNKNDDEEKEEEEEKEENDEQFKPVIVLVGTKSDLKNEDKVSMDEIQKYSKALKSEYFETSVKINKGVEDLFFFMAKELFDKKKIISQNKGFRLIIDKNGEEGQSKSKVVCC